MQAGTTLDVWFPFVIDPSLRYSLTIAHTDPAIGPMDATISDNTAHFALPAFGLRPGAEVQGEIDGGPR